MKIFEKNQVAIIIYMNEMNINNYNVSVYNYLI